MIYLTSDTHFLHANIIKYCDRPYNHNSLMQEGWNEVVTQEDTVYHLGDFCLGNKERASEILSDLNGEKILLLGNHDGSATRMLSMGFYEVVTRNTPIEMVYEDLVLVLSHEPVPEGTLRDLSREYKRTVVNVHGHIHNNKPFGLRVVDQKKKSKYNVYYLNISTEVTDYRPVSLDSILELVRGGEQRCTPSSTTTPC